MSRLTLSIVLPVAVFASYDDITHVAVETPTGVIGLLPRRRDCVAPLVPGIVAYRRHGNQTGYIAIDRGIMVKVADTITLSVRRAFTSNQLEELENVISTYDQDQDEEDRELRSLFAKMESGLLRRLADYHHG